MNYVQMLQSELNHYTKQGYIPQLKIWEMSYREMEKIADYCFSIEQNISFEELNNNTNRGYYATEQEIKKIIEKRRM